MAKVIYTKSYLQTQQIAAEIASQPEKLQLIALHGNLGSGKTTFMQGMANKLGIKNHMVSPTFLIMRSYTLHPKEKTNKKYLYHIDLYRIQDIKEIESIGIIDIMNDPKNIVAIEWPEKISSILPQDRLDIALEYIDENTRKITISNLNTTNSSTKE